MAEENGQPTGTTAQNRPQATARRFNEFRMQTTAFARHQPVLFLFGIVTMLGGLLGAGSDWDWGNHAGSWTDVSMLLWPLLSAGALAAAFFLHPSRERAARWLFVAGIVLLVKGWGLWGSPMLLVGSLALVAVVPLLERSGFAHSLALYGAAFAACAGALGMAVFRGPFPGEHVGLFRGLLLALCLGWAVGAFRLRSVPASTKVPQILLAAALALAMVLGYAWCIPGRFAARVASSGLLLAALLVHALDDTPIPGGAGTGAGARIRRYGPAAAAAVHAASEFILVLVSISVGGLAVWVPWLLLAAFLAMRCGWLKEKSIRSRFSASREAVSGGGRPKGSVGLNALRDKTTSTGPYRSGAMPISWGVLQVFAWLVLAVWIGLGATALANDRVFHLGVYGAVFCGIGALLTGGWFLVLALCEKFEEGVGCLESRCGSIVRTPMCLSWIILRQLGMVMIVLLTLGLIGTGIAWLSDNLPGRFPLRMLLFLLALAPHFLHLFLAHRFHDAVCALETVAGDRKPKPEPMPASWHVFLVIQWIVTAILLVAGGVLIVKACVPHAVYSYHSIAYRHDWEYLWGGILCWLAAIPIAFGFVGLFLMERYWSAVACLRVLTFRLAEDPAAEEEAEEKTAEPEGDDVSRGEDDGVAPEDAGGKPETGANEG